jgi:predicted transposase YdaD
MPIEDSLPPHDFADQAVREQLENPSNLRELLHAVLGDLAEGFICEQREVLKREFPLEDWRHRESDLLFRIPYCAAGETVPVFVCVLIEHQSRADPLMPLRTLLYTVLFWEREWKAWTEAASPGPPLRLTPVVPIVFHTGKTPWRKNRALAELIGGPGQFAEYAPHWQPLFFDLAGKTSEELLHVAGQWFNALAVVRADAEDYDKFRVILVEAIRHLEVMEEKDRVRWHELMRFVLQWAIYRRPADEKQALIEIARASQSDVARQKEIQSMGQTIAEALRAEGKIEGIAEGIAKGKLEGKVEGKLEGKVEGKLEGKVEGRLTEARETLCDLLEGKFSALPESLRKRIEATTDLACLKNAIRQVLQLKSLDELQL